MATKGNPTKGNPWKKDEKVNGLTSAEALEYLQQYTDITMKALLGLRERGILIGAKVGPRLYYGQEELDAYLKLRLGGGGKVSEKLQKQLEGLPKIPATPGQEILADPGAQGLQNTTEQEARGLSEKPEGLENIPVVSKKMPACYHCKKRFLPDEEYELAQFEDEAGEAIWRPVCKGGCQIDYKGKYERAVEALKTLRSYIDQVLTDS